ncbi:MAG: DUF928 domain-containing protein [Kastovskya adunca ATA6-11-RM4]|jgi:hypothetical protein|nr:DUF928 domain-containing protein [Kastovskya adunca ATA6-11-RM4]
MAGIKSLPVRLSLVLSQSLAIATVFSLMPPTASTVLAQGIPQRWEANKYQPPANIGAPDRTETAGTRSASLGTANSCPVTGKPLTALIPRNRFGVTVAAYPTFFVYLPTTTPQASPRLVEFFLQDEAGNEIYRSTFQASGNSGIVSLSLPKQGDLLPLAIGNNYKWAFSIICRPDDRATDIGVEGWIRRVPIKAVLNRQLVQVPPKRQVEILAEAEIWHDALAILAQLRRDNPNDLAVAAEWEKLLGAAGLDNMARESLVPSGTTSDRQMSQIQP